MHIGKLPQPAGLEEAVDDYIRHHQGLSPTTIDHLDAIVAPHIHFQDPLHDIHGLEALKALHLKTFQVLDQPRVLISDRAFSEDTAYLRWTFVCKQRGRTWTIEGVSEIRCDAAHRIAEHIDHWDVGGQVYEKLPMIGGIIRRLRERVSR